MLDLHGICGPNGNPITARDVFIEAWKVRGLDREEIEEALALYPPVDLNTELEELKAEIQLRMEPPISPATLERLRSCNAMENAGWDPSP